jgi:hypothetical protein
MHILFSLAVYWTSTNLHIMHLFFQEPKPYWFPGNEEEETPLGWDLVPTPWNCSPHPSKGKSILFLYSWNFHLSYLSMLHSIPCFLILRFHYCVDSIPSLCFFCCCWSCTTCFASLVERIHKSYTILERGKLTMKMSWCSLLFQQYMCILV